MAQISTAQDKINGEQPTVDIRRVYEGEERLGDLLEHCSDLKRREVKNLRGTQNVEKKSIRHGKYFRKGTSSNQRAKTLDQQAGENCDGVGG